MRLLVVVLVLVSTLGVLGRHVRHRRDHDLHDWLNEEQKNELKTMDRKSAEFKAKIREFYSLLSEDKKAKWNEFYRNHCWEWTKKVTDNIEHEEIMKLIADKQVDKLKEKINGLKGKLDEQHRSSFEAWENDCYELTERSNRKRRQIDADFNDFISWMSDEQKKQIGEMKSAGKLENEIHEKVKEYFSSLDSAKQTELKNQFKGKCKDYFKPLMTDEEIEKIKSVKDDMKAAGDLIKSVVDKQSGEDKTKAEKMFKICGQVYKESSRKRRDHDGHYNSFIGWMTDDQKKEIGEMKKSGKPEEDVHNKVKEFFGKLSEEKQKELKDEFKVKCRNFFIPLMNDEEKQKIKSVKGDKEAARALIEGIVNRQEGDRKKGAEKMFKICREVYKESSRRRREQIGTITRRDVRTKIEKHLAWLTDDQKAEIEQMSKVGAGKDDIRKKLFEFVAVHEKDPTLKEKTIKKCYEWMEKVASKEEIESLHQMHHTDHAGCKKKVREFIGRLPESEQGEVNSSLPFCEKLWYGDHEAHHDDSHHHHHHRRRRHRRHLQAIEKFLNWLEPEQLENLKELEASGVDFNEVMDKIKEYFHALDEDKKNELTGRLKNQCKRWAQEVSKPSDWEELKASYEKKDYAALREKLVELEDRLTENQKHIIEHLRGACYRVWDIKGISRLRRSFTH